MSAMACRSRPNLKRCVDLIPGTPDSCLRGLRILLFDPYGCVHAAMYEIQPMLKALLL